MKRIISLVLAGIIGGMIALGGVQFMQKNQIDQSSNPEFSTFANNRTLNSSPVVPFDFTAAAEIATPAVVHIAAAESEQLAQQRKQKEGEKYRNPFEEFFGKDFFFGDPYGGGGQLRKGSGSGVIFSSDGYIVTNNHVVEFADEVKVTLFNNKKYIAKVVGTYPKADLAVIKIEETGLPILKIADSDNAKVGQWVLAIGNPLELASTVTAGIISAKGRDINIIQGQDAIESFIQTDAAVNPGNSGGALVDAQGRLLGINTAIATRTGYFSGYSFAIPVNLMKRIVEDIIENGSYQKGSLGVYISDLDDEFAQELGLNISQGVVVRELIDGCAAQYAGILPNDVIVKVNGKKVDSSPSLQEKIGRVKIGDSLDITVNRNGSIVTLPVRIKDCDTGQRF